MKIQLNCLDTNAAEKSTLIDQFPAVIGRDPDAAIQMKNISASRRHCRLELREDKVVIRDLGSQNGTMLNGEAVTESNLNSGDVISVGLTQFCVQLLSQDDIASDNEAEKRQSWAHDSSMGVWHSLLHLCSRWVSPSSKAISRITSTR